MNMSLEETVYVIKNLDMEIKVEKEPHKHAEQLNVYYNKISKKTTMVINKLAETRKYDEIYIFIKYEDMYRIKDSLLHLYDIRGYEVYVEYRPGDKCVNNYICLYRLQKMHNNKASHEL